MAGQRLSSPINFNYQAMNNFKLWTIAADPAAGALVNGALWHNSTSNTVKARLNGATATLSAGNLVTKFSATIGDGAATSYAITHNLGSTDIFVQAYVISTGANSSNVTSVTRNSANQVTIVFGSAPALNTVKVVVLAA